MLTTLGGVLQELEAPSLINGDKLILGRVLGFRDGGISVLPWTMDSYHWNRLTSDWLLELSVTNSSGVWLVLIISLKENKRR